MKILKTILITFALAVSLPIVAQEDCFPSKQDAQGKLVYDESNMLQAGEERFLNEKLSDYARTTSNQIVVVIVNDLCDYSPQEYATEIGHQWGVGVDEFDNGVVVLVKPTGGQGERHTFIATGYGLEGAIPDATCKMIVDQELIPNFKNQQFYRGLDLATNTLMELARGDYNSDEYYAQQARKKKKKGVVILVIQVLFFIGIFFFWVFRARRYAAHNDVSFWTALWLINSASRRHGGYFNNFNSGGGGFGGFGGGGFGGGGAGGSW